MLSISTIHYNTVKPIPEFKLKTSDLPSGYIKISCPNCLAPSGWVLKILEVEDYLFHNYKKQLLDGENHANYTS